MSIKNLLTHDNIIGSENKIKKRMNICSLGSGVWISIIFCRRWFVDRDCHCSSLQSRTVPWRCGKRFSNSKEKASYDRGVLYGRYGVGEVGQLNRSLNSHSAWPGLRVDGFASVSSNIDRYWSSTTPGFYDEGPLTAVRRAWGPCCRCVLHTLSHTQPFCTHSW